MPEITSSFTNLFNFLGLMGPLLMAFFLIILSLFNLDLKGIVYLSGLLCASIINLIFMNQLQSRIPDNAKQICRLWNLNFFGSSWNDFNSPSLGSMFMGFTFIYLYLPMHAHNQINYAVIATILVLFGLNATVNYNNNCNSIESIFLGVLSGVLLGISWYTIFHNAGYDGLLFYPELQSNNVICKKPAKQTFKCSVYKNGEMISNGIV